MNTKERIEKLLSENPVILFMKGSPEQPQCGFSARVVQILNFLKVKYQFFDVLSDETIRQGIKEHENWPTIPQLYLQKKLLGGCDIIQEQFQSGDLEKALSSYISD
ncbi:MAG: Grx4 family monothiol glutaredoxin [Bdellovibrionales bacterium]